MVVPLAGVPEVRCAGLPGPHSTASLFVARGSTPLFGIHSWLDWTRPVGFDCGAAGGQVLPESLMALQEMDKMG
jgi:hypothetical protein